VKPLRIFLIDDSTLFRDSAALVLSGFDGVEVVGEAESAADAFKKLKRVAADLLLMDISMPEMNGLEATARIKARSDAPRVVIVTAHNDAEYRAAARVAGADGFIVKNRFSESIGALIRQFGQSGTEWNAPRQASVEET
jgi:DNA-binding NarL/FixJ family response regulator